MALTARPCFSPTEHNLYQTKQRCDCNGSRQKQDHSKIMSEHRQNRNIVQAQKSQTFLTPSQSYFSLALVYLP